jgi:hypothetical protein
MTSRFLTISAAVGVMLAAAGPAGAQSHGWGSGPSAYADDDYRTSYADAQRAAFDNGYRDGLKRGEQAARDGRPLYVELERDYRSAENGYNRSHGDRNRYRDSYRGGFSQGYREGYNRRSARPAYPDTGRYDGRGSGYGGNAGYGAYQNGAADGYKKGLDDVNDRKYPDVSRQKWYRNGDHDYDRRYGSKETYSVEYRRGFEEGYNRAYRDARRY